MVDIEEQVRRLEATRSWSARHLLLWEATDLYGYILETQSLSVVRGASVLLELFCEHLDDVLGSAGINQADYAPIQAAASKIVLVVKDESVAGQIGTALYHRFQQAPFRGTSGWVSAPLHADRAAAQMADLSARLVLQRMRQLDVDTGGYPAPHAPGIDGLDPIDGVRLVPRDAHVTQTRTAPDGVGMRLGDHTRAAFHVGQQHRFGLAEALYARWCVRNQQPYAGSTWTLTQWGALANAQPASGPFPQGQHFLQDFQALGQASRLPGYIAVLEADGNGFGKWMAQFSTVDDIARASAVMQAAVMDALVTALSPELHRMHAAVPLRDADATQEAQLIVNAGDEFVLVLRGDRGLSAAHAFLDAWPDAARQAAQTYDLRCDTPLHTRGFGLGLVISHATTPIQHLRDAAHELVNAAKSAAKNAEKKAEENAENDSDSNIPDGAAPSTSPHSALDFALLKSHDVPPDGVLRERERWLTSPGTERHIQRPPRSPEDLSALVALARHLHDSGFPARQLERRVAWLSGPWLEGNAAWKDHPPWSPDAKSIVDEVDDEQWVRWLCDATDHALFELRELLDLVAVEGRGNPAPEQGGQP